MSQELPKGEPDEGCSRDSEFSEVPIKSSGSEEGSGAFKSPVFLKPLPASSKKSVKHEQDVPKIFAPSPVVEQCDKADVGNKKSPIQQVTENATPIPYKEPPWSGLPSEEYHFDVLKGGVILEQKPFNKPFLVVGRLTHCDIVMEHPSISRFHSVVQYCAEESKSQSKGIYVYDLGSTHGTFLNKKRLLPDCYQRIHVGHILQFGGSTRMFILEGPDSDREPESELTVTELKQAAAVRSERLRKLELLEQNEEEHEKEKMETSTTSSGTGGNGDEGIDWGMGEDAVESDGEDIEGNPFALEQELHLSDPKKTLRGWFEREGYDLPDYKVDEISHGHYVCKLELPISTSAGACEVAMVEHKGKKKESVSLCAMEACRILDRHGVLRQATHESHMNKRKKDWEENDYYESDDDDFLDQTGDVRKKRLNRMTASKKKGTSEVLTYDTLLAQYNEVVRETEKLQSKLDEVDRLKRKQREVDEERKLCSAEERDAVDAFMDDLQSQVPDKHKRMNWRIQLSKLKAEEVRLCKLVNVARPAGVSKLESLSSEGTAVHLKVEKKTFSLYPSLGHCAKAKPSLEQQTLLKGIHKVFIEEVDDVQKSKIPKVNFEDDSDQVAAVPYSSGRKAGSHLQQQSAKASVDPSLKLRPRDKDAVETSQPSNAVQTAHTSQSTGICIESQTDKSENSGPPSEKVMKCQQIMGPAFPPDFKKYVSSVKSVVKTKGESEDRTHYEKDYESWVPPAGQTGDGRTALNDKYGY